MHISFHFGVSQTALRRVLTSCIIALSRIPTIQHIVMRFVLLSVSHFLQDLACMQTIVVQYRILKKSWVILQNATVIRDLAEDL